MSDHIPFEIQHEIMKRLPVKSLIRFRCVSKPWKSLIHSSKFVADYHRTLPRNRHLLIRYTDIEDYSKQKYVSILDDETFPQHKFTHIVPVSISLLNYCPRIIGSSQGLFCVYNYLKKPHDPGTMKVVLWNPTIRRSLALTVPDVLDMSNYDIEIGFGVCPKSNDPKLVKITISDIRWQVEVFALSSRSWRNLSIDLPFKLVKFHRDQVVINEFISWLTIDNIQVEDEFQHYYLIMSFDITLEKFTQLYLPDRLRDSAESLYTHGIMSSISKLRESLVVLQSKKLVGRQIYDVWMMENGDPKSFTKQFTINSYLIRALLGFGMSGEPAVTKKKGVEPYSKEDALFVYEPYSQHFYYIGIYGRRYSSIATSYMETLLCLINETVVLDNNIAKCEALNRRLLEPQSRYEELIAILLLKSLR